MSVIDEILKAPEDLKELNRIDFRLEVSIVFAKAMAGENISQTELAKKLGVSKGRVSQVLHGDRNITIDTLADYALALGCNIDFELVPKRIEASLKDIAANWDRPARETTKPPARPDNLLDFITPLTKKNQQEKSAQGDDREMKMCGAGHAS